MLAAFKIHIISYHCLSLLYHISNNMGNDYLYCRVKEYFIPCSHGGIKWEKIKCIFSKSLTSSGIKNLFSYILKEIKANTNIKWSQT